MNSFILVALISITSANCMSIVARKPVDVKIKCYTGLCDKVRVFIDGMDGKKPVELRFDAFQITDLEKLVYVEVDETQACGYYGTAESSINGEVRWCSNDKVATDIEVQLMEPGRKIEVSYDIQVGDYVLTETIETPEPEVLEPVEAPEEKDLGPTNELHDDVPPKVVVNSPETVSAEEIEETPTAKVPTKKGSVEESKKTDAVDVLPTKGGKSVHGTETKKDWREVGEESTTTTEAPKKSYFNKWFIIGAAVVLTLLAICCAIACAYNTKPEEAHALPTTARPTGAHMRSSRHV